MRFSNFTILAAALALAGCATTAEPSGGDLLAQMFAPVSDAKVRAVEAGGHPLGSEKNPVRANMPAGQRAYLARLRCSDGTAPSFERRGNVGAGPYGKIVDLYDVKCATGQPATASVYIDMYHDHVEDRPVPSFTIAPRS